MKPTGRMRVVAGVLALLSAQSVASAPASPATAGAGAERERAVLRRATLIVRDTEASIRFYRDVLGFTVWLENRGQVTPKSLPSDAPVGAPSRFTIMKGRHPWVGMIGLLQYGDARPAAPAPPKLVPGDVVLMVETDDLEGAWERMKAAGTPVLRPPETTEVTGAGGSKWTASFVFVFDPDGHLIELNQRRPAAGAAASADSGAGVEIRRGFVDTRLGQVHYRRAVPLAAQGVKTPLVLLHQTPLSGRMFTEFMPAVATDRIVCAPDTPGYGESTVPAKRPSMGEYADALGDFLESLGEPVDLLGYHTGAALAVELASRFPQRVRRVVLVSVPLLSDEQKARFGQPAATLPIREDGTHLVDMWQSTMSVRPPGQSVEAAARLVAEKQRSVTNTEWALASLAEYPLDQRLRGLGQPVLLLRPKDGLWEQSGRAAVLVPGATVVDRPDWGYGIFDAYPAELAAVLRPFLDR